MNLTETPDVVIWPSGHYVFIEKIGPFMETAPKAWELLHKNLGKIADHSRVSQFMSLYKMNPQMTYRAGVVVDSKPSTLPEGFQHTKLEGGEYTRFILTGPYSDLPEACGRVFEIVKKTKIKIRDSFFIENYVNDPKVTPADKLVTEILIPT